MRGYLRPALALTAAALLIVAQGYLEPAWLSAAVLVFGLALYVFAAVWWVRRSASLEARLWPHAVLAYAPVLPVLVAVRQMMGYDDEGRFFAPPLLIATVGLCSTAPLVLVVRLWAARINADEGAN